MNFLFLFQKCLFFRYQIFYCHQKAFLLRYQKNPFYLFSASRRGQKCAHFLCHLQGKRHFLRLQKVTIYGASRLLFWPTLEGLKNPFFLQKKPTWPFITFQQEKKFSHDPGDFLFFSFFCKWKSGRGGGGRELSAKWRGEEGSEGAVAPPPLLWGGYEEIQQSFKFKSIFKLTLKAAFLCKGFLKK